MQPQNQQQYPPAVDPYGYAPAAPQGVPIQQPGDPQLQQQYVAQQPGAPMADPYTQQPAMQQYPPAVDPYGYAPAAPQGVPIQQPGDPQLQQQYVAQQPGAPMAGMASVAMHEAAISPTPPNPGLTLPDAAVQGATGAKQAQKSTPPRPKNTTQNSLLFSEIRDNMVVMADGSFRSVVACESINFDLMSAREREGVEFSYQNFINSLTHPIQILIRSQKVDIGPYIDRLSKIRKSQDNMLLGVLMDDYIDFVDILSEEANIMDKSFYVVIPYSPTGDLSNIKDKGKGFLSGLFGGGNANQAITKIDRITYEKAKDEMKHRIDSVTSGLFAMGVRCAQLNTKQLGELYYSYYNPDIAIREPLSNFESNTFTYVRQGQGEAQRPNIGGTV